MSKDTCKTGGLVSHGVANSAGVATCGYPPSDQLPDATRSSRMCSQELKFLSL